MWFTLPRDSPYPAFPYIATIVKWLIIAACVLDFCKWYATSAVKLTYSLLLKLLQNFNFVCSWYWSDHIQLPSHWEAVRSEPCICIIWPCNVQPLSSKLSTATSAAPNNRRYVWLVEKYSRFWGQTRILEKFTHCMPQKCSVKSGLWCHSDWQAVAKVSPEFSFFNLLLCVKQL